MMCVSCGMVAMTSISNTSVRPGITVGPDLAVMPLVCMVLSVFVEFSVVG